MWKTVNKYFTIVPMAPYAVSILGAALRHQPLSHLLTNGISLVFFGLSLHEDVGRGTFLAIFFASGAVGGFSALAWNVLRQNWYTYIFGSSSCVLGVAAAAIVVRPERKMKVAGYELPVAMWLLLVLYGTAQVVVAARGLMPGIDHAGHIGGLVVGTVSAWMLRRKATRARDGRDLEPAVSTVEQAERTPVAA
jgi:rhomboid-like protein